MDDNKNLPKLRRADNIDDTIANLEKVEQLAEYILDSALAKNFEDVVDGKPVVRKGDIVAAILFGAELGLTPMKTLNLGRQLNKTSYFSIARGKNMGLDEITSLQNIHCFSAGSRVIVYTGVHVISKVLIDAGVDIEWIDDFRVHYWYFDYSSKDEIDVKEVESNPDTYFIATPNSKAEAITKAKTDGKKFVTRKPDRITSAIFKRGNSTPVHIKYYLSDAVEAGLYAGTNSVGEKIDGKDNWNKYPKRMMRNRVIITGGREVAADKLFDTYLPDEVSSISPEANIVEDVEHEDLTKNN